MEQVINDITVWAAAYDWLRIVLTIAVFIIPTLVFLWLTLFASGKAITAARGVYKQIRQFFDEPTDPLVMLIAARTGLSADEVIKWLTSPDGILLKVDAAPDDARAKATPLTVGWYPPEKVPGRINTGEAVR